MQTLLTERELEHAEYEGRVLSQVKGTKMRMSNRIAQVQDAKTKKLINIELAIMSERICAGGDAIRLIGNLRKGLE